MNQQPKYRFYPSLLDKFEQYLRADEQVAGKVLQKMKS